MLKTCFFNSAPAFSAHLLIIIHISYEAHLRVTFWVARQCRVEFVCLLLSGGSPSCGHSLPLCIKCPTELAVTFWKPHCCVWLNKAFLSAQSFPATTGPTHCGYEWSKMSPTRHTFTYDTQIQAQSCILIGVCVRFWTVAGGINEASFFPHFTELCCQKVLCQLCQN